MTETDPIVEAIFDAVAVTAPEIRAALPGRRVESGTDNPSGESVMAGDLYADELLADALTAVDGVGSFVSEEREAAVDAGGGVGEDAYAVAIDPSTAPRISGRTTRWGPSSGYTTRRSLRPDATSSPPATCSTAPSRR